MFSRFYEHDQYLQQAFKVAFALHPDRVVAWEVVKDGFDRIPDIRGHEVRRGSAANPFKMEIPDCALAQFGIYYASDRWERGQETGVYEGGTNKERLHYQPTVDDFLVRYIKLLIWQTAPRNLDNVAAGLCKLLYTYSYAQIWSLAPDLIDDNNIRRVTLRLRKLIKNRFAHLNIISNEQNAIIRRLPDARERLLVQNTLQSLAPIVPAHGKLAVLSLNDFYSHFHGKSGRLSWEGVHLLIDPACAGLQHILDVYERECSEGVVMKLPETQKKLAIPAFKGAAPNDVDRFSPPPLTSVELRKLREELAEREQGKKSFSSGQLRVCVDGAEQTRFWSQAGESGTFSIPLPASYLEVFAETEGRDLLLAFFPLHSLDAVEMGESIELRVTINSKARMSCAVIPEMSDTGDITAGLMTVRYEPTVSFFSRLTGFTAQPLRTLLARMADSIVVQGVPPRTSYAWLLKTAFFVLLSVSALYLGMKVLMPNKNTTGDKKMALIVGGDNFEKKNAEKKNETAPKFDAQSKIIEYSGHGVAIEIEPDKPAVAQSTEVRIKAGVVSNRDNTQNKNVTKSAAGATKLRNPAQVAFRIPGREFMQTILKRKLAPYVAIKDKKIKIISVALGNTPQEVSEMLQTKLITDVQKDTGFIEDKNNPETLLKFTVTAFDVKFRSGQRQSGNTTIPFTAVNGNIEVSYQAIDARNNAPVDSENLVDMFKQDYPSANNSSFGRVAMPHRFVNKDPDTTPSQSEVRNFLINRIVKQIAQRAVPVEERFTVLLPLGKLDQLSRLAQTQSWSNLIESAERTGPLEKEKEDSYRIYLIGVGNEGLAYEQTTNDAVRDYLLKARTYYDEARIKNPGEEYYIESWARVDKAVSQYDKINQQAEEYRQYIASRSGRRVTPPPAAPPDRSISGSVSGNSASTGVGGDKNEPTEKEMKEAWLKQVKTEGGHRGVAVSTPSNKVVSDLPVEIEEFKKLRCKPTDEGAGYLCTYSVTYYIARRSRETTAKRSEETTSPLEPGKAFGESPRANYRTETATRRFVQDKESWIAIDP